VAQDKASGGVCTCGGNQAIGGEHRLFLQYDIMTIKAWLVGQIANLSYG